MRTPSGEFACLEKVMNIALNIQQNAHLFKREKGEPHACVDNSLSCLAKLCYSQPVSNDQVKFMLSRFPMLDDEEEAQASHKLLFRQVIANGQKFAGVQAETKEALRRIRQAVEARPKDELLDDEGKQLLA